MNNRARTIGTSDPRGDAMRLASNRAHRAAGFNAPAARLELKAAGRACKIWVICPLFKGYQRRCMELRL